jgi:aspartate/methionine/tyrosine aminotransferase
MATRTALRPDRLAGLPALGVDAAAAAAGSDPGVLRLENLDTDVPPPAAAIAALRDSAGRDEANSYLPFTGSRELRELVAAQLERQTGRAHDPETEVVITCGGTEGMFDALLATVQHGDEVVVTDPTYVGMLSRVRLAGATPVGVPLRTHGPEWRLDLDALQSALSPRTRALFVMNPSMPTGAVLNAEEWAAIAAACERTGAVLIYNAAMERILYDGRPFIHPATLTNRTLTVGSLSKERRMIGWRVGWVAGPAELMADVIACHLFNVVTPVGIAAAAGCAALRAGDDDVTTAVAEWERRRDTVVEQLQGLPVVPAAGGWSLLLHARPLGFSGPELAARLLHHGRMAATPMDGWGEVNGADWVRLVFSNEPVERLGDLGERVHRSLV